MHRATRTCILASALALTGLATSCAEEPASQAPATPAAPPATTPAAGVASTPTPPPNATTAPASNAPVTGADAVAHIRDRAQRLWEAKLTEDWATVYDLRDPAVRTEGTQEEYVAWSEKSEPFRVEGYDLGEVLVEGTMAWVQVDAQLSTRQFKTPARGIDRWDKWRFIKGDDWYPVPQKLLDHYPVSPVLRDREAEEHLRERFMVSWQARKDRDWQAYMDMYTPSDREIMTLDEFAKVNDMFIYDDVEVLWVEVIGRRGHIRVAITERVTDPSLSKMPATVAISTETWRLVDGEWYVYLGLAERSTTSPPAQPPLGIGSQNQSRGGS